MLGNMPCDILHEVLIRLPAESLIRSRAVCRGWRAVIDDPPFVRAHQPHLMISSIVIVRNSTGCYSFDMEALSTFSSNGFQTITATPLDFSFVDKPGVSACNGLFLTEKPLGIWNPSTHERLDLPPPPGDFELSHPPNFGLGYDYVTDDYKVVAISSTRRETHVYSLKSGSWRSAIMNCPPGPAPKGRGVFVCGALNWLSLGDEVVYSLDLGTEKYMLLHQVPQPLNGSQHMKLDVLGGCLILCDHGYLVRLVVWVMRDFGDEGSWTKLFSFDGVNPFLSWVWSLIRPVAFIRKGDDKRLQVFLQAYNECDDDFRFFLLDVETNSINRIFVLGPNPQKLCAQQMFHGTKFGLHANCGGGGGGGARPKIATSSSKKKTSSPADKDQ